MSLLTDFAARSTTRAHEINIDSLVLLVTFCVSLLTGVIFGSRPALGSRYNLATSLRAATARVSANRTSQRIRSGLIVAQVGVSFVLLIGAGLTLRSLLKLEGIDPGFTPELFAALALVITCAGIAGVIAFAVGQRTQEIGIRVALGARPAMVVWLVVRQGVWMILAGVLIGICGSVWLSRLMAGLLYNVQPMDAVTFISVSLVLVAVAGFACFLPARRTTRVDPLVALRFE
jgi:hypothetical protein